jgi:hypothetical protein
VILNYDQYPTSVEQYGKRVFGDLKLGKQTKNKAQKQNKTKSKNKQKKKNSHH